MATAAEQQPVIEDFESPDDYPVELLEVDEFLRQEMDGEADRAIDVMKILMEPPLPRPIALGKIVEDGFGFYKKLGIEELENEPKYIAQDIVKRYTIMNQNKVIVQVINYGATIISMSYPDRTGQHADVVMGFENLEGYLSGDNPTFGGTLGRYSSIITGAEGKIGTEEFFLSENKGNDHVCGGFFGFDKVLWDSHVDRDRVIMTYTAADKEEGYPGNLMVQLTFRLTSNNQFIVHTSATCSKPTPISVAHNMYFNLAGHGMGPEAIKQHVMLVNADRWMLTDSVTGKYTGDVANVGATYFDLRVPRPVGKALARVPGGGYDTTFCLTKGLAKKAITFAARLVHPESGRFLEIFTDQPSMHITTGNKLPDPDRIWANMMATTSSQDKKPLFICKDVEEEGDWMWPQRMMSKMSWPRPASVPEEEHVFRRFSELSIEAEQEEDEQSEGDELMLLNQEQSRFLNVGTLGAEVYGEGFFELEQAGEEEEEVPDWVPPKPIEGKAGCQYKYQGAISFVTQEYPDPFKFKRHPRPFIFPGQEYSRTTIYKFGIVPPREDVAAVMAQIT